MLQHNSSLPKTADPADRYIDSVKRLPAAPTVAMELLEVFKDKNRNVDRIVELISLDPSLTMEVLKRCNSAFFRGREEVRDMFSAVTRVGFFEIYCLVVSMLAARTMEMSRPGSVIDPDTLWQHSVITAVAAETLAGRTHQSRPDAFTAGLLHDVGKLIFASEEPLIYEHIVNGVGDHGPLLLDLEHSHLGVTHACVGARLLSRWGLPSNVSVAVMHHHNPALAPVQFMQIAATIGVANVVAHQVTDRSAEDYVPPTLSPGTVESMKAIGLAPEYLPDIILHTEKGLKRMESLLNMVKTKADPHGFSAVVS